ncbi:hypothetical protein [Hymenobacter sp. UYCo722]|uniref:hypothetical protein n=1 Tax=Hymenobacter sp. UYCo722 TaxID=3156335 RepID=UPI0033957237
MSTPDTPATPGFDRARAGLWASLQKHLAPLYAAETAFSKASDFATDFPFSVGDVPAMALAEYWRSRYTLRDLYTDETAQLDTLTKAIRTKGYSEAEKKQLYLLLLGYFDIAASIFSLLETHIPRPLPPDEEWAETDARFDRIRKFARLNVKGITGLLTLPG